MKSNLTSMEGPILSIFGAVILVVAIVVVFTIVPQLGFNVETATVIPGPTHATGTLTFTGNVSSGELVNISTFTFEFTTSGTVGAGHIPVNVTNMTGVPYADQSVAIANLTAVMNAHPEILATAASS